MVGRLMLFEVFAAFSAGAMQYISIVQNLNATK